MKREISTTQFVIVICIVVAVIVAGAAWMFHKPAATDAGSAPPVGTPESAAAARQRGQEMRESMREAHSRPRQQPGGPGSQATSP